MKRFLILTFSVLLMVISSLSAFAQKGVKVSVKLNEGDSGEPLSYATVSLTVKNETKVYKYTLTSDKGSASFDNVKAATYIFKAELMGYKTYEKEFTVKEANVDLGTVSLSLDTEALDAATVAAIGNPIIIKKDTVEYNADAFRTTENDVLEDLLKKLPGIEVESSGSITANGQSISKIRVNGKEYFANDPTLATKNLPAKIVKKVKVIQKKSDQAEFTGIDDGEEETIIDIQVRDGMMNGLMGNATLGAGHDLPVENTNGKFEALDDNRYTGNLFLSNFTDAGMLSIIGNANNANNAGSGRGFMGGMGGMGGGMGGGSNGITTSYTLGATYSSEFLDGDLKATADYSFSGSENASNSISDRTTFLDKYDLVNHTESLSNRTNNSHQTSGRIEYSPSKNTSIIFTPTLTYSYGDNASLTLTDSKMDANKNGIESEFTPSTDGFSMSVSSTNSLSTSGNLQIRQRILIPGRTLTASVRYSLSDSDSDGYTQSLTNTYGDNGSVKSQIINQRTVNTSRSSSASFNTTYTEPLGNNFYLEGNYQISWSHSESNKDAFDTGDGNALFKNVTKDIYSAGNYMNLASSMYSKVGEIENLGYSNKTINNNINQTIGTNIAYQATGLRFQLGFSVRPSLMKNETSVGATKRDPIERKQVNYAPTSLVQWDINDNWNMRLNYRGSTSQPSISQLQPVPDNSDPTRYSFGNPQLKKMTFSHDFSSDWRYSNRQKYASANLRLGAGITQDPIINTVWYDSNRIQYSMPFNGPSSYNANINLTTSNSLFNNKLSISTTTSARGSQSTSYVATTGKIDMSKYMGLTDSGFYDAATFNYDTFLADYGNISDYKDIFPENLTQTLTFSENVTLTYRTNYIELRTGIRTNVQKSWYTLSEDKDPTYSNTATASFTWTSGDKLGMSFKTDGNYNWYVGYTTDVEPEFLLNAELTKLIFKKRVTLGVKATDILGQRKAFSFSETDNYRQESVSNSLGRYFLVTLSYRFGSFGGRNARSSGSRGMMGGMMGGGMPGGGMPGGFGGGRPGGM